MKKTFAAITLAVTSLTALADPVGYPGSNWSELNLNPSVISGTPEDNNYLFQGKVEQGIDWTRYGNWTFNTYASVGYSLDKNGLPYNNKFTPALGLKFSRGFDSGVVSVGVQAVHQHNFRGVQVGPNSGTGVQVYANYWFGWDLKR